MRGLVWFAVWRICDLFVKVHVDASDRLAPSSFRACSQSYHTDVGICADRLRNLIQFSCIVQSG